MGAAAARSGRLYATLTSGTVAERREAQEEIAGLVGLPPEETSDSMVEVFLLAEQFDAAETLIGRLSDELAKQGDLLRLAPMLWTRGALEYRLGDWMPPRRVTPRRRRSGR